ncbi:uncharacterized protein LOC135099722 isoform X1 [Scylla paramamosain]|uniref:uncharacterized protein LOC135099722 isoform X1 n=1 Tax=Scylla paramamosain TaxID=85552 RepID=UPI003083B65B
MRVRVLVRCAAYSSLVYSFRAAGRDFGSVVRRGSVPATSKQYLSGGAAAAIHHHAFKGKFGPRWARIWAPQGRLGGECCQPLVVVGRSLSEQDAALGMPPVWLSPLGSQEGLGFTEPYCHLTSSCSVLTVLGGGGDWEGRVGVRGYCGKNFTTSIALISFPSSSWLGGLKV